MSNSDKRGVVMIDRESRSMGSNILTAYLAGTLDPDDFESAWGRLSARSIDPALKPIGWAVWCTYDDLTRGKRTANINSGWREVLERCHRFLESDEEYWWKTKSLGNLEVILNNPEFVTQWPFAPNSQGNERESV